MDRSRIKRRQYHVMIIAVDCDVKHQIKQVSSKFDYFTDIFVGTFVCFRFGYFGLCDKIIYLRF